jgi:hypothetical protein
MQVDGFFCFQAVGKITSQVFSNFLLPVPVRNIEETWQQ